MRILGKPLLSVVAWVMVLGLVAGAGCSSVPDDEAGPGDGGRSVAHAYGETVVDGTPERVISVGLREHDPLLALGVVPIALHQWYAEFESGVGPWAEPLLKGAHPEVIPATQTELDVEWIAAQAPDLIVGTYAAIDEELYRKLSGIAPTIVKPAGADDYVVSYQDETRMIGEALGKPEQAAELVEQTEAAFADARQAHPEFEGKAAAAGCPLEGGALGLYSSKDPRGTFLTELGFTVPDEIDQAAGGQYYAEVSAESIDMVEDLDVLVLIDDCGPPTVPLEEHTIFNSLKIAKRGAYVYPAPASDAVSHNTVVSIPYAIERLVPAIAETLAKN